MNPHGIEQNKKIKSDLIHKNTQYRTVKNIKKQQQSFRWHLHRTPWIEEVAEPQVQEPTEADVCSNLWREQTSLLQKHCQLFDSTLHR